MSPLPKMKSGIALAVISLIALATFLWVEARPAAGIGQLLAKSVVIPDTAKTGVSKIDENGRPMTEIKFADGHTEWALDVDAIEAADSGR